MPDTPTPEEREHRIVVIDPLGNAHGSATERTVDAVRRHTEERIEKAREAHKRGDDEGIVWGIDVILLRLVARIEDLEAELDRREQEHQEKIDRLTEGTMIACEEHGMKLGLRQWGCPECVRVMRDEISRHAEEIRKAKEPLLKRMLTIWKNDKTEYEHHEARPFDGEKPRDVDGGSIFLTPREIAEDALREAGINPWDVSRAPSPPPQEKP